ncbi:hypothetical protein B9Z55_011271 [Caenorhabditis nigoni]|uniref:Sdz-33 F-box domain-containing protein n=1 Tax=Caenorhabditis nigoni TaxID=1611254 RepID=A0A2G5UJW8_9PELO|nr:hypothetical protein B9Z55_011271 [Caenorhabditis nigoni]
MANLKQLSINTLHPEFDHLPTWNTERCLFLANHIPLRDLNRFFKFWTKGSNPRLKYLEVLGHTVTDWNGLMKGLQAEGKEDRTRTVKEYTIWNCYGTCARIKIINYQPIRVAIMFTVSE